MIRHIVVKVYRKLLRPENTPLVLREQKVRTDQMQNDDQNSNDTWSKGNTRNDKALLKYSD